VRVLHGRRATAAILGCLAAAGIACAAAYALWSGPGSGSGSLPVESVASVSLAPGTPTTDLYPGTSGDVAVSIVNGNTFRAYIGSLVLDTTQGDGGFSVTGAPGCDPAALAFTSQSNGGAGWFVPPGSTLDLDLANAISLDTTAASACQGATFVVYLLAAA
jgi:hypothetical protein